LAEKVVCEDREQEGSGNSFSYMDMLNLPNPTRKNAPILRHNKPKPGTFL
jgi:hypothetical protein